MSIWLALLIAASSVISAFCYWRALRLSARIHAIEPQFRGLIERLLSRKDRR